MLGERWGVTDQDVARRFACDDLVPAPAQQLWRGVSVAAQPEALWPWVGQLRLAPYSYDLVDNLGRRSPRELCGLPEPAVGDRFAVVGRIAAVTPGVELTGEIGRSGGLAGRTVMSYQLVPDGAGTRLLLKVVVERGGPLTKAVTTVLPLGDLVMARKQLMTLRSLAESR